ncbi:uncharacterized protein LOC125212590 isoform X2 [Salvia hispanica]|uniref:uncharacterized protein LOC125212590 isoform X2 n=1 Tax=Salvia hispanica TaxID=49212 RepID=UPI002009A89F|nr:uncharacterized protein LOC125212590 isoform X2 [Salvia hispanica]
MAEFNHKEWCVKPQISTNTRRFSASNWKSFREDERSLRTATTISSTVSSPGYTATDKIDPSTYSFTAAIKGLQRRGVWSCEYIGGLQSKWSDAEKYISNPLSGQVPVECLSAKALGVRSFSTLTSNRITISAPLHFQTFKIQEKKTRDVGTQSADVSVSVSAPNTPSIQETSPRGESVDSSLSTHKQMPQQKVGETENKEKEIRNTEQGRERKKKAMMMCSQEGGRRRGGCLSFKGLWQRRNKCNCKPKKNYKTHSSSSPTFLYHINACYDV